MKKIINYKVTGEEWLKAQDEAFKKLNKDATIDGFRKGKATRDMYEKHYSKEKIYIEAADTLIEIKYNDIILKDKIIPILEPKIDLVKMDKDELEVNLEFITKPEATLGEYKDLKVKKDVVKVSKDEIQAEVNHILDKYAELKSVEGKVKKGHTAVIDFEGFKDGVPFEGGKGENYPLEIGSNTFIPGFEDKIIGMAKDEEREINVTFPEDYASPELHGKEVVFKVKVHDIKERIIPELTKEFFEDLDMEGINTKEELESMVKDQISSEKERIAENKYIDDLLEAASKNMKVEIDKEIIDYEAENMYHDFLDKMSMQGVTEEIYLQYANTTKEDIISKMTTEAEKRVKYRYLLEAIAKTEKIEITDKDAKAEVKSISEKYDITEEEVMKEFGSLDVIKFDLSFRKAIEILKGNK